MKKNTAILFLTHFTDSEIIAQYNNIENDCDNEFDIILLYDNTRSDFNPFSYSDSDRLRYFTFTLNDLRGMSYQKIKNISTTRNVINNRRIANNAEIPILLFYLKNPHYSYYWVVEYDVRFTGSWNDFFSYFSNNDADLLGTTLFRYDVRPNWTHWHFLKTPGRKLEKADLIRGFLPIYRISNRALAQLHYAYMDGWTGHPEVTIPTILKYSGFRIEDIGGDGEFVDHKNLNRFYRNTPKNEGLSPGTFVFRPVIPHPGDERGKIWHPVKVPSREGMIKAPKNLRYQAKRLLKKLLGRFFFQCFPGQA